MELFEPHVVAFCCQWCSYAAADLAGSMRLEYPPSIKIIRVPCTGRVDIIHMLRAFELRADGVFLSGCLEGDCHFVRGNLWAAKRVSATKAVLKSIGTDPSRLEMYYNSSSMGPQFVQTCKEFTRRIIELGPLWRSASDAA